MKRFRTLIAWLAMRLGGASLLRLAANHYRAKKQSSGRLEFPFIRTRRRANAQILTYHRVNDDYDPFFPATAVNFFAQQMEYVADKYRVCTLDEVVKGLFNGDLPDNAIAITFDDGYKDNYLHAFPILKRLKLPATIFLVTDPIEHRRCLWHDRVFLSFRESRVPVLENFGCDGKTYPLRTLLEKCNALDQVLKFLWSLEDEAKAEWIDRLREKLGIVNEPDGESLMLDWVDIREMSKHGIGFGSHTKSHPILSKVHPARAKREVEESKKVIEDNLDLPVKHFAYPVGRQQDLSQLAKKMLRHAGYDCAVTSILGCNDFGQDCFELRRATPWDQDIDSFALRLSYFKFVS